MPHNTCQIYLPLLTITHPGCCLSCVFVKSLKVFLLAPPLIPLPPIILFAIGVLKHLRITRAHSDNFSKYFPSQFLFFTFINFLMKENPLRDGKSCLNLMMCKGRSWDTTVSDKFHSSLLCVGNDKTLIDCWDNKVSFLYKVKKSRTRKRRRSRDQRRGEFPWTELIWQCAAFSDVSRKS